MMKLLGSTKNKITKDEKGENVPHAEITEVVLAHCNIVNNDHQHDPRVLYIFVSNKLFGQLLDTSPKHFLFFKLCFTDQNSKPLEIEDETNITLVIILCIT